MCFLALVGAALFEMPPGRDAMSVVPARFVVQVGIAARQRRKTQVAGHRAAVDAAPVALHADLKVHAARLPAQFAALPTACLVVVELGGPPTGRPERAFLRGGLLPG